MRPEAFAESSQYLGLIGRCTHQSFMRVNLTKRSLLGLATVMVGMFVYMVWMMLTGRRPQSAGVVIVGVAYWCGSAAIAAYAALCLNGRARRRAAIILVSVLTFLLLMGAVLTVALSRSEMGQAGNPGIADVVLLSVYLLSLLSVWFAIIVENRMATGED